MKGQGLGACLAMPSASQVVQTLSLFSEQLSQSSFIMNDIFIFHSFSIQY